LLGLAREFAREFAREISGACPRNCPRNFWGLPAKLTAKFLGPAREIDREIDREIENKIENEMPRELPANSKHTRKYNICTVGAPEQIFGNVFVFCIIAFLLVCCLPYNLWDGQPCNLLDRSDLVAPAPFPSHQTGALEVLHPLAGQAAKGIPTPVYSKN